MQQDRMLQAQVYRRLDQLIGLDTDEEDEEAGPPLKIFKDRKYRRAMTADDRVVRHIDWPHFYVYKGGLLNL